MSSTTEVSRLRRQVGIDFSKAVDFNVATSLISYTTPAAINGTTDYSYFQWFYPRTIDSLSRRLFEQNNQGLLVILTSVGLQIQARHASTNGQVTIPPTYILKNTWHSLVVNWSDTMTYPDVYLDGQMLDIAPINKSGARLAASTPTTLGNRGAVDRGFDGLLDKHAFMTRLATFDEITAFNQKGTLPTTGVVAYEMDETSGSLVDATGNGVSGTVSNATQNVTGYSIPTRTTATTRPVASARTTL